MNYTNENFGMMDEGYFVPRTEIISWVNGLLKLNLSKIQQLGSGSIYCQILDVIHPGKVALNKVNWKAKNDYEFINNFKVLQSSFQKLGIKRHVQVEKLSKAKYQDNLEFIQWMKRYYDVNCGQRGTNYAAEERRGNIQPDLSFADKTIVKHVYNGGGVQQEVSRPRKPTANLDSDKKTDKIREKANTQIAKTPGSMTNIKAVVSPKKEGVKEVKEFKAEEVKKPDKEEKKGDYKEEEFDEMLNSERKLFEKTKEDMEKRMAADLLEMQEKLMEQQLKHQEKIHAYKQKVDMIRDILKGKESAQLKVKLIEQVMSI